MKEQRWQDRIIFRRILSPGHWGLSSDVMQLGDYDGDGPTDRVVTQAVDGQRVFFILQGSTGQSRN